MASTWPTAKLGDVIDLFDSQRVPLNSRQRHERQGKYPYYGAQGVIDHVDGYIFDGRYILVAEDGENLNSKKLPLALFASGRFWVNNHAHILRGKEDIADDTFLLACLNNADIKPFVTGAAQPKLSQGNLRLIGIPLPPLPIQRRIAGILSAYDELIENSQRRIKILESMARALYREWFVHFRFPGHEHHPRVPSPLGEIPQGWHATSLGDLCELRKDPYRDAEHSALPLLDMARMPSRSLAPNDTGSPAELTTSRILFQRGDTLFGAIRCYLHKVVAAHYPGVTNTSVLVLRPKSPSFRSLVAIVASDIDTIRWAETQSTGTKMPVINWGVFQGMSAPIPSKTVAIAFEDIAGPMLDEIGVLATQIQNLRRTRDLLLPRLLSGQIDVEAIAS